MAAAQREIAEETAARIAKYLPLDPTQPLVPLAIDTHLIPANLKRGEPEHYHHDFRYVFIAADEAYARQESETDDIGWFALDSPECQALGSILQKLHTFGLANA